MNEKMEISFFTHIECKLHYARLTFELAKKLG